MSIVGVGIDSSSSSSGGGRACILALNETDIDALHLQGNNDLIATDCVVHVNSKHQNSIDAVGTARASADEFCTMGEVSGEHHFTPRPTTGCGKITLSVPFVPMQAPNSYEPVYTNTSIKKQDGSKILSPGIYDGGLEIRTHAEVTLNPGVYVVKDGPLEVASQAELWGENIVFYFTGSNTNLIVMSGADVKLTPRESGPYKGFLFVQDPASNAGETTKIQGGGSIDMSGILYTPTWTVEIGGNGDINEDASYWAMIADTFYMRGNGELHVKSHPDIEDLLPISPPKITLTN